MSAALFLAASEASTAWNVFEIIALVLFFLASVIMLLLILARPPEGEGLSSAFGGGSASATFGVGAQKTVDKIIRYFALIVLVAALFVAFKVRRFGQPGAGLDDEREIEKTK